MAATRRKFVIKRHTPTKVFTVEKARETWQKLKSAIEYIQGYNASKLSFEELYRYSYNLVLYKHGHMLYDGVTMTVRSFLQQVAESVATASDNMLLETLQDKWYMHQLTMKMIRDILMYMDRTYVQQSKSLSVYEMGLREFRNVVLRHVRVGARARNLALQQIREQRLGEQVDTSLLRGHLRMLVELGIGSLGVYESEFESQFLRDTRVFYREEAQDLLTASTCPAYLARAEQRVVEERERVGEYLDISTGTKLRTVVEQELVETHAASLLEMDTGLIRMLDEHQLEHLHRLFYLFSMVKRTYKWEQRAPVAGDAKASAAGSVSPAAAAAAGGAASGAGASSGASASAPGVARVLTPIGIVRAMMQQHLEAVGTQLLADSTATKDPVAFVRKLLELRDHYEKVVREAFRGNREMARGMKESFEKFLNVDHRCAQFLSLYVDSELRTGFRGRTTDDIDHDLNCVILLFRYLRDKDVFETFYKQHLQRRLLGGRSASDEAERMMIAKLKSECGYQFTSNIEGMFTDLTNSRALMAAYTKALRERRRKLTAEASEPSRVVLTDAINGVELHATVLTTVHWPNSHEPPCTLPKEVQPTAHHFKDWYLQSHSGRLLRWHTAQGTAEIGLKYANRRYEIVASTYQMAMLCQYNGIETPSLTYRQIADATTVPEAECKRHLLSLTTPLARILIKERKGKDIKDDDVFRLNLAFKSPKLRNRIKLITMKSATGGTSAAASTELPAHVLAQRNNMIDAAVVRIMKSRKSLQHMALIAETTRYLSQRFQPDPQLVRKRIENLIDRDYLERDNDDRRVYHYIA